VSHSKFPHAWVHRGFDELSRGRCEDGGANLYVNARGVIEMIHRTDVNHDGYADIIFPNSHGYTERGPTWIYEPIRAARGDWPRRELPNDSGWMSRVADVDGDGHDDLIVVNGENGVTSELDSYVYWGGPNGLSGERTELPTIGAYDVAAVDLTGDGPKDLIFPSAWVDHHNPGRPRPIQFYVHSAPRRFEDASRQFDLTGIGAASLACADLTGDGHPDLVVANYRREFDYEVDSFIYWGRDGGFDTEPFRLPTHTALHVIAADLNGDGFPEIIFSGGGHVWIYWNDGGVFEPERRTVIETIGFDTMFCQGAVHCHVADVDGDGRPELIMATRDGVQIRSSKDLDRIKLELPIPYATWVHAADLDGDGRPELIVSKYDDHVTYETESAVFWNGPDGFSADRATFVPTGGAMGCTAGDLGGDGRPRVVFNNTMLGPSQFWKDFPVYVYLGGRDADYGTHRRLELPTGNGMSDGYVLADLDLDGYHDLVIATEGLRIFHGGPEGPGPDRFTDLVVDASGYVMQVQVADFNGDGYLDLLASVQTYDDRPETMARSTRIYYGSADGFSPDRFAVVPTYCSGNVHLADLDSTGHLDMIVGDKRGYLLIYHGGRQGYSMQRTTRIEAGVPWVSSINSADLNGNGFLDLVVGVQSHYLRRDETFIILYGGPDGYNLENSQKYMGRYTPGGITIADYNGDGHLDLLVGGYSSRVTRVLPAKLFHGDGQRIDLDHPVEIHADSPFQIMPYDLNRNGYLDLVVVCHRDDTSHQVDSLIFWNGPEGISRRRTTRLPGMGPHWLTVRDPGNARTREPVEAYVSPPFDLDGRVPTRLGWDASVPPTTRLRMQIRWAELETRLDGASWHGPEGEGTFFEEPGTPIAGVPRRARCIQYRAEFTSPYGVASAQLREVRIDLDTTKD
jgi:hypothetical protein